MGIKPIQTALVVSLTVHLAGAAAPGFLQFVAHRNDPVEIEVVQYTPEKAPAPAAKPKAEPAKAIKTPAKPVGIKPSALRLPASAPKTAAPKRASSVQIGPPVRGMRRSAELLSDPKTAKLFTGYFTAVKEKLDRTVRREYENHGVGQGSVCLYFVLNSDGSVERVSVVDAQSNASMYVKAFAMGCLKKSAPFIAFPEKLDATQISFNVTVLFEEV